MKALRTIAALGRGRRKAGEEMNKTEWSISHRRYSLGRWFIVLVLTAVAGVLLVELTSRDATANEQAEMARDSGRLFAVAGKISADTYGVYLVDRDTRKMAIYQWLAGKPGKLKLVATRNCTFDLQLDEYNTEPSPEEIRQLVREGRSLGDSSPR